MILGDWEVYGWVFVLELKVGLWFNSDYKSFLIMFVWR